MQGTAGVRALRAAVTALILAAEVELDQKTKARQLATLVWTEPPQAPSARTMALDPVTHRVHTVAARLGTPAAGQRRPPVLPGTFELLVLSR